MRSVLVDIETCCKTIVEETEGILTWEWDDYIGAMLAVFTADEVQAVDSVLERNFASRWGEDSIHEAPDLVQELSEKLGGIRKSQYLFVTPPDRTVTAFGAWWPWGDEQTISLRIGLLTHNMTPFDEERTMNEFIGWFEKEE